MVTSLFLNSTKQITAQDLFDQINSSYKNTRLNRSKHNKKKHQQELIKKQQRTRTKQNTQNAKGLRGSAVHSMLMGDELLWFKQKRQL